MYIISFFNITKTLHNMKLAVAYVKASCGLLKAVGQML